MRLLELNNITKNYSLDLILNKINMRINEEEKIGLIGPNGCGKTTLLKQIMGIENPDEGNIVKTQGIKISFVPQNPDLEVGQLVIDYLFSDYKEIIKSLKKAEEKLSSATEENYEEYVEEYQKVRDLYDNENIDTKLALGDSVLTRCNLIQYKNEKAINLSGGEKNILALAKALLKDPDLLILDEPGNHLDYKGLAWLENFLKESKCAVLVVSHNRYLLDKVCTKIFELENQSLTQYVGNYSQYRMEKLKKLLAQQADYNANQKRLDQLRNLVKKFEEITKRLSDPKWGKRLRARRTQLKKEEGNAVDKPFLDNSKLDLAFNTEKTKSNIALKINNYSKAFDQNIIFENADTEINCGERVALFGENGSGKTTFIKDLIEFGDWNHETIKIGPSQEIAYMEQHPDLNSNETIEEHIRSTGTLTKDQAFAIASGFKFTWNDMDKKLCSLSGGERNRLQLALIMNSKANFLILDEPTNHMDIPSREVIEEALLDYKGTILVVSHDRYFLEKIATKVISIENKKLNSYDLSFSEYWSLKKDDNQWKKSTTPKKTKKNRVKLENEKEIEKKILEAEKEKTLLEKKITESFNNGNLNEGKRHSKNLDKIIKRINELYDKWN